MRLPAHILIVEDNPADRKLIEVALSTLEQRPHYTFADDGQMALDFLRDTGEAPLIDLPDLIILDQNMPRMDGFELLHELRQDTRLKEIPVAMFSTSPLPKWYAPPTPHRADAYITKPFDVDEYTRIIHDLCTEWIKVKKL